MGDRPADKPITVHRPFLHSAPAVLVTASLLLGCLAGRYTRDCGPAWLPAAVPIVSVLALVQPSPLSLGSAGLAVGIALERLRTSRPGEVPDLGGRDLTLKGKVTRQRPSFYGQNFLVVRVSEACGRACEPVNFDLSVSLPEGREIIHGSVIRMRVSLKEAGRGAFNPAIRGRVVRGGWLYETRHPFPLWKGRERVRKTVQGFRDSPATGMLGAIALGERWRVDVKTRQTLRRTGTYHLLAISGVHVAAAILPFMLFMRLFGLVSQRPGPRSTRILLLLISGCAVLYYTRFTGLSASALRATVYFFVAGSSVLAGRSPLSLTGLSWCVLIIVSFSRADQQPDLSLSLSALAVIGIILSHSGRAGLLEGLTRMTLGAVLFTLPVAVWLAGGISVIAPVGNIVAGITFGLILIPSAVLMDWAALFPWLSLKPLMNAWLRAADPVMGVLAHQAVLSFSFQRLSPAGCLAASAAAVTGIFFWSKKNYRPGAGIVVFLSIIAVSGGVQLLDERINRDHVTIVFPAVGRADAAVIRHGGKTVLVDCGPPGIPGRDSPAARALQRLGIRHIDAIFLSHSHPDHAGGVMDVLAMWPECVLYVGAEGSGNTEGTKRLKGFQADGIQILHYGEAVVIGSLRFTVCGPGNTADQKGDLNRMSVQLLLEADGFKALFTGDAGWDQVRRSMERISSLDLLKIPHHGSGKGFPPAGMGETLKRLRRSGDMVAVCPSRPPGRGHLPAREVVRWFQVRGVRLVYTGERVVKIRYKKRGSGENGSTVVDNHYPF